MISIPRTLAMTAALWASLALVFALGIGAGWEIVAFGVCAAVATLGIAHLFRDHGDKRMALLGAAGGAALGLVLPLGPLTVLMPFLLASVGFYAGPDRRPIAA